MRTITSRSRTSKDRQRGLLLTHWWLVVLATFMAVGSALAVAYVKPVTYTATAEVVVAPQQTKTTLIQPNMGTEQAIAESGVVIQDAASALQVSQETVADSVSVGVVLNASVLRIGYSAGNAEAAFLGANAVARTYVAYRNKQGGGNVTTLVTPASLPTTGSHGKLPIFLVLGLMAGLSVGAGAAWLWDRLSDRVRSSSEVERLTGLPVLARLRRWESVTSPLPPVGPAREPFAYAAARLTSMIAQGSRKTIVVTSPRAGAGTTSTACGIAAALAAQGKRVVLIAASHEGIRPEQVLEATTPPELAQLLARGCSPELALHPTAVRNVSVIPTGGATGVDLGLDDLNVVLERLERLAFVVIDAPPLLVSAESLLLANAADLVVLVGDLRAGTRTDVKDSLTLLKDVEPRLAGWVCNAPPRRRRRALAQQRLVLDAAGVVADEQEEAEEAEEPTAVTREPGRLDGASVRARLRSGMGSPAAPTTESTRPIGDLPVRERGAASRRP